MREIEVDLKVREVVRRHLRSVVDQISDEAELVRDLGADSLDRNNIVFDVEDVFDIDLTDAEIASVVTVGDVSKLVRRKLEEQ